MKLCSLDVCSLKFSVFQGGSEGGGSIGFPDYAGFPQRKAPAVGGFVPSFLFPIYLKLSLF